MVVLVGASSVVLRMLASALAQVAALALVLHMLASVLAQVAAALVLHSCCSVASAWASVLAAWPAHKLQVDAHSDSPPA